MKKSKKKVLVYIWNSNHKFSHFSLHAHKKILNNFHTQQYFACLVRLFFLFTYKFSSLWLLFWFSIFNYVWYCSIGADKFGWCELFIRRADKLLLYHSSSADMPVKLIVLMNILLKGYCIRVSCPRFEYIFLRENWFILPFNYTVTSYINVNLWNRFIEEKKPATSIS